MGDMDSVPAEVEEITKLAQASLDRSECLPKDRLYTHREDGEWFVGDNYERIGFTLVYSDSKWFTRCKFTGDDTPMTYNDARENAQFYYG